MVLHAELRERLQRERLGSLVVQALDALGVEATEDLELVGEQDLDHWEDAGTITTIQRRRFLKLRTELLRVSPSRSASSASLPSSQRSPPAPQPSPTAPGSPCFSLRPEGRLKARQRPQILVPRVKLSIEANGEALRAELDSDDMMHLREAQLLCGPAQDWLWLRAELPWCPSKLSTVVALAQLEGLKYKGRAYYMASSTKGSFRQGSTVWFASPPSNGGPAALEGALGWGTCFKMKPPTEARPHPEFLLRARVKQLFAAVTAAIDTDILTVKVVQDFRDEDGRLRDDGDGETDPEIAEALASIALGQDESALDDETGLSRNVPGSFQIRCGGMKGMLVEVERLRGTHRIEVPENMIKFDMRGKELGVISFSKVRPTSLGIDAILRFEARGVDQSVFIEAQKIHLRKISGSLTLRRAFRVLNVGEHASDLPGNQARCSTYMTSFVKMLLAGFDPKQHPLLSVILKQQGRALERAQKEVRARGIWLARGHTEPRPSEGEPLELYGNQVFFMYPSQDADDDYKVLTGKLVVNYISDRSPGALRMAEAIDSPTLRRKCKPGLLYISLRGPPLQAGLSWDCDGDYFQLVTNQAFLQGFQEEYTGTARPRLQAQSGSSSGAAHSLAELQSYFLRTFPDKDHIGLYHYQWQLAAGAYPGAAGSQAAEALAAGYAASLDVEKGGPWPERPSGGPQPKWDFMKGAGPNPRRSPTAAGAVFRLAQEALRQFEAGVQAGLGSGADAHLASAWGGVSRRLGEIKVKKLMDMAGAVRGRLINRIKEDLRRGEAESPDCNLGSQSGYHEKDQIFEEWLENVRSEERRNAETLGASLTDLALAAWYLKYVTQGVADRPEDPDTSFPWRLFCMELCEVREAAQPCCQLAMERHLRLLQRLRRAAAAAREDEDCARRQRRLAEAAEALRRSRLRCPECNRDLERQRDAIDLDASAGQICEAMQAIARGEVRRVCCEELFYAKAAIEARFRNGKQQGQALSELVDKLVDDERAGHQAGLLRELELGAVRYHGRIFVVEGNRRLWCVKRAASLLRRSLAVRVRVADLYLGWVRQQGARPPALRLFWTKFTTATFGESVSFVDDASTGPSQCRPDAAEEVDFHVLFSNPDLTEHDKKELYHKLCLQHHPDKGGSTPVFQRLRAAYEAAR